MEYMFFNCTSLLSLPDISNWNISKVSNMKFMFYKCISLISLPDISNWNITNANTIKMRNNPYLKRPKFFQNNSNFINLFIYSLFLFK